jgi:hypothetical protein
MCPTKRTARAKTPPTCSKTKEKMATLDSLSVGDEVKDLHVKVLQVLKKTKVFALAIIADTTGCAEIHAKGIVIVKQ